MKKTALLVNRKENGKVVKTEIVAAFFIEGLAHECADAFNFTSDAHAPDAQNFYFTLPWENAMVLVGAGNINQPAAE